MGLLRKKGYTVQPFKAGPDYLDPGFHSLMCGRISRNLDTRLLSSDWIRRIFTRAAGEAEIAVVEGVMGYYDGAGALDEWGSSYSLAKTLRCPVVLVLDIASAARSVAAWALGFRDLLPEANIQAFILNNAGSPRHGAMVKEAVEAATKLPVLGTVAKGALPDLPGRHLGLVSVWEDVFSEETMGKLTQGIEEAVDYEELLRIAEQAPVIHGGADYPPAVEGEGVPVAYALDRSFHFYYQDNLDILEHLGAKLIPFSPLEDPQVPPEARGIYFGGGYPELAAEGLSKNSSMINSLRILSAKGLPIYGECGGLLYLVENLVDFQGRNWEMTGLLPGTARMDKKLRALGYYDAVLKKDTPCGPAGTEIRGHVYHYSVLESGWDTGFKDEDYVLRLNKEGIVRFDGLVRGNTFASYLHVHFASSLNWARNFVASCRSYQEKQEMRI